LVNEGAGAAGKDDDDEVQDETGLALIKWGHQQGKALVTSVILADS